MHLQETEIAYIEEVVENLTHLEEPIGPKTSIEGDGLFEIVICIAIVLRAIATLVEAISQLSKSKTKED